MKLITRSFLAIAAVLIIASCSSQQNAATSNPTASRGKFTGTWTISDINYDGIIENAVKTVFDQGPPSVFRGSTWQLTNSGNGLYTLTSGVSQTIYWSVNNSDPSGQLFQFKKIFQGDKAKNVTEGYQLNVVSNNGSTMVVKSPVAMGGGNAYVVYTFTKTR